MLTIVGDLGEATPVRSLDDLGRAVRLRRRQRRLTQQEVATAAGVGRGVLQKLEEGRGTITVDSLLRIAAALSLEVLVSSRRPGLVSPGSSR
jgi:HTH-type transcriptional regulator / antitoxin HipB